MQLELRVALHKDQQVLQKETDKLKKEIDEKYGLLSRKEILDIVALADDFYHGKLPDKEGLPREIIRELTNDEIRDLKMVFDMFDVKKRGLVL